MVELQVPVLDMAKILLLGDKRDGHSRCCGGWLRGRLCRQGMMGFLDPIGKLLNIGSSMNNLISKFVNQIVVDSSINVISSTYVIAT